jgi:Eisosome component PIL1
MFCDRLLTCIIRSRTSWKNVRDAEVQIAPRRAARNNLLAQINKLKTEGGKTGGVDTRLTDLDAQLKKAEADDAPLENELELLKRTAIKESETTKWKALQEASHRLNYSPSSLSDTLIVRTKAGFAGRGF